MEYPFIYAWGNNPKRALMKGRRCRIIASGAKNSIMIEFENGQREITSRYSIKEEQMATFPKKRNYRKQAPPAPAPAAKRTYTRRAAPSAQPLPPEPQEQQYEPEQPPVEAYDEGQPAQEAYPAEERGRQPYQPRRQPPARGGYQRPAPRQQQDDGEFRIITPLYHSPRSITVFLKDEKYDQLMEYLTALQPGDMIGVKDDGQKAYLYAIYHSGTAPTNTRGRR